VCSEKQAFPEKRCGLCHLGSQGGMPVKNLGRRPARLSMRSISREIMVAQGSVNGFNTSRLCGILKEGLKG